MIVITPPNAPVQGARVEVVSGEEVEQAGEQKEAGDE